jgi:hypothetical protein
VGADGKLLPRHSVTYLVSGVVTLEGHDHLKVLFQEHFQDLFLVFILAQHTRLGSEKSLAHEYCLLKDVVANVDLLQMVLVSHMYDPGVANMAVKMAQKFESAQQLAIDELLKHQKCVRREREIE